MNALGAPPCCTEFGRCLTALCLRCLQALIMGDVQQHVLEGQSVEPCPLEGIFIALECRTILTANCTWPSIQGVRLLLGALIICT